MAFKHHTHASELSKSDHMRELSDLPLLTRCSGVPFPTQSSSSLIWKKASCFSRFVLRKGSSIFSKSTKSRNSSRPSTSESLGGSNPSTSSTSVYPYTPFLLSPSNIPSSTQQPASLLSSSSPSLPPFSISSLNLSSDPNTPSLNSYQNEIGISSMLGETMEEYYVRLKAIMQTIKRSDVARAHRRRFTVIGRWLERGRGFGRSPE